MKKRGRPRKKDPEDEIEEILRKEAAGKNVTPFSGFTKEAAGRNATPFSGFTKKQQEDEELSKKKGQEDQKEDEAQRKEEEDGIPGTRIVPDVEYQPTEPDEDFPGEDEIQEEEKAQIEVHRLALPLPDKRGITILNALIDMYLALRSEGTHVQQVHSDLGRRICGGQAGEVVQGEMHFALHDSRSGTSIKWKGGTIGSSHEDRDQEDTESGRSRPEVVANCGQVSQ